jgi:hypothetical protein
MTAREIDNAEAAHPKADSFVQIMAMVVRTSVPDDPAHGFQCTFANLSGVLQTKHAINAAHVMNL